MKTILRIMAALALVGALGACAELGIPAPSMQMQTPDPVNVPG